MAFPGHHPPGLVRSIELRQKGPRSPTASSCAIPPLLVDLVLNPSCTPLDFFSSLVLSAQFHGLQSPSPMAAVGRSASRRRTNFRKNRYSRILNLFCYNSHNKTGTYTILNRSAIFL